MSDGTKIEWTDATINAINGCSVVSPGCTNCYAMRLAGTRMQHHPSRAGLTIPSKAGPVWTGDVRLSETALLQPLHWKRPRRIFWNAHGDMFHPNVPEEWIDRCFVVMALTPQHTHQVLTKRSQRMKEYFLKQQSLKRSQLVEKFPELKAAEENIALWMLKNVWLGVSVEDQPRADARILDLLATPAAVRFLSVEPMLGPIDLEYPSTLFPGGPLYCCSGHECGCRGMPTDPPLIHGINWCIVGGESGPGARPMHPDWARSLRDQCQNAHVAFHFKQWGNWRPPLSEAEAYDTSKGRAGSPPAFIVAQDGTVHCYENDHAIGGKVMFNVGKKAAGRLLDGRLWDEMPT